MRTYKRNSVISPEPSEGFVITPEISEIIERAMSFLASGFPVHFSGPTGTGKTTLATHLAYKLKRPVMYLFGDEESSTSDLVGGSFGYRKRKVIDNFIHSVLKTEEDVMQRWVDNRLTTAIKHGFTLIYDEFNRSRPEANNAFLSVLEEGILTLPTAAEEDGYLKVHPNFRAIFTSNPEEYAGVHKAQDALLDRMVTVHLDYFDEDTERDIITSRSGISREDASRIVKILRDFRKLNGLGSPTTLRPGIVIGTILKQKEGKASFGEPFFTQLCIDALISGRNKGEGIKQATVLIGELVKKHTQEGQTSSFFPQPPRNEQKQPVSETKSYPEPKKKNWFFKQEKERG